jgi:hypothetical protein
VTILNPYTVNTGCPVVTVFYEYYTMYVGGSAYSGVLYLSFGVQGTTTLTFTFPGLFVTHFTPGEEIPFVSSCHYLFVSLMVDLY